MGRRYKFEVYPVGRPPVDAVQNTVPSHRAGARGGVRYTAVFSWKSPG